MWPLPPAAPRVRLAAIVSTAAAVQRRSWWRTAFSWITGKPEDESTGDMLARPFDVSLEPSGGMIVADPDGRRVIRYDERGAFVAELVCRELSWSIPMGVAALRDGAVVVADAGAAAIVRWTPGGCEVLRSAGLQRPTGIASDGERIIVADPPAHQVVALSASGRVLARWGELGDGPGQLHFPTDVALDSDGSVFVVDSLNFRIAHIGRDGSWLGAFGAPGETGAGLERPKGIFVDSAGRVYVTDAQRDAVLVFRRDGTFEYDIGAAGEGPGRFAHPAGIVAAGNRLAVADSLNRRVQVFETLAEGP